MLDNYFIIISYVMCSLKHTELTKQLQLQLTSLREEHQGALQQLKEAHSLIDKHVKSNSRLQTSEVYMPSNTPPLHAFTVVFNCGLTRSFLIVSYIHVCRGY